MSDSISKITNILLVVMIALTGVFAILFYVDVVGTPKDTAPPDTWVNNFLKYAYVLGIVAAAAAVFFGLFSFVMKFVDSPKKGLVSLIPILGLVFVVIISYSLASDAILDMKQYDGPDNVHGTLKWSGTGLYTMYILLGLAVLSIVYVEVAKLFK